MKLPFSFGRKKEPIAYYLALLLRDETVSVVVLEEKNTKLYVVTQETMQLTKPIEELEEEELLDTLDKAITKIESQLPKGAGLQKTVFGLKETWVEEAHIKKNYLAKLKKISEELELQPIGFLVFSEAISHLLQQEEGAPISALLMEIGKQTTTIALIRGGRVTETHIAVYEHSIVKVAESLLAKVISVEILPSRILLFASEESKKAAQQLLAHRWSKELPFLHVPQVSVLPLGFDIKAVLHGTATQLGFIADENYTYISTSETLPNEIVPEQEIKKIDQEEQKIATDNFTAADFGFAINEDVTQKTPALAIKNSENQDNKHDTTDKVIEEIPEEVKEAMTGQINNQDSFARDGILITQGAKSFLKKLFAKKKKNYSPPKIIEPEVLIKKSKREINKAFIIFPLLTIVFVASILFYIFKEKATITITISPKDAIQSETVTFSADKGNNFDDKQISGATTTITEDGTLQAPATGKKSVGDKAKGTITMYNPDDTDKTIPSGTTITSSNGFKFTLDRDIEIASASGDIFSGTKPGTADGTITANDIGTEYNFPSGTKFAVGNSTTVAAKNSSAFSGGTKKEVTMVTKSDATNLLDQLTKNLQSKGQYDMNSQRNSDKILLPVFLSTKVTKKSFDKNIGDQTTTVTLTETISFQGITYAKQDVQDFAKHAMKNKIYHDMQLDDTAITADVIEAKQKNDTQISATIKINAKLYATIDTNQLAQTIKGESFSKAANFLNNQPQVSHVEMVLHPNIPFLPKMLPRNENNIFIVVKKLTK